MKIVLASNNPGKLAELHAMFAPLGLDLVTQGSLGIPEAAEPFHTESLAQLYSIRATVAEHFGRYAEVDHFYQKAQRAAQRAYPEKSREKAKIWVKTAEYHERRGQFSAALEAYQQAIIQVFQAFNSTDWRDNPPPESAFRFGDKGDDPVQMYLNDIFTIAANLTGAPALSMPCGFTKGGLPIGLQVQGNYFAESLILNVAHRYQQATDWHLRAPPIA